MTRYKTDALKTSNMRYETKAFFLLINSLFMEDTLPRYQILVGTPMSLGSFARCLRITSCRYGKW